MHLPQLIFSSLSHPSFTSLSSNPLTSPISRSLAATLSVAFSSTVSDRSLVEQAKGTGVESGTARLHGLYVSLHKPSASAAETSIPVAVSLGPSTCLSKLSLSSLALPMSSLSDRSPSFSSSCNSGTPLISHQMATFNNTT